MRTFKKLDRLKTEPIKEVVKQTDEEESKAVMDEWRKEKEAASRRNYLAHRRTQSILLGMEDKISSFFSPSRKVLDQTASKKSKRNKADDLSKNRQLELKIEDVDNSSDEESPTKRDKMKKGLKNGELSPNSKAKLEADKLLLANSSPRTMASTKRVNGDDTDAKNNKNGDNSGIQDGDPFAIDTKRVNWADKDSQGNDLDSATRAANALKMAQTDPNHPNHPNNKMRMKLDSGGSSLHASKTPIMSITKMKGNDYGLHDTDYDNKFKNKNHDMGYSTELGTTNNSISALRTTTSTKKSNVSKFLTKSQINDYDMNAYLKSIGKDPQNRQIKGRYLNEVYTATSTPEKGLRMDKVLSCAYSGKGMESSMILPKHFRITDGHVNKLNKMRGSDASIYGQYVNRLDTQEYFFSDRKKSQIDMQATFLKEKLKRIQQFEKTQQSQQTIYGTLPQIGSNKFHTQKNFFIPN